MDERALRPTPSSNPCAWLRALRRVLAGAVLGVAVLTSPWAWAEVELGVKGGWRLTTDGRLNDFLSVARGNAIPAGAPSTYSGLDDQPTAAGDVASARVRTGFIASVLGFELSRNLTDATTVQGRVAFWILAASAKSTSDSPGVEAREAFFKLEGDGGSLLVGRAMSLFARGGILLNYDLEHAYGLGSPCQIKQVQGGACGHSGFGLLFPGFHSGLVYGTPSFGGLQLSAGLYDPAALSAADYRRTPLPRAEAELTFATPGRAFSAFVGGLWQRVSRTTTDGDKKVDQDADAWGINYGLGLALGPLALGVSGYQGQGLGFFSALEDSPANFLNGKPGLRKQHGYYGAAALVFGGTRLAAGAGLSAADSDPGDPPDTASQTAFLKQQVGVSLGVYQTVYKFVVLAVEYFGAQYTWFDYAETRGADTYVIRPRQAVNFVNAGATFTW